MNTKIYLRNMELKKKLTIHNLKDL